LIKQPPFSTIHFNKKLVEGIFTLIIASAPKLTTSAGTANSIYFVNKNYAWRIFASLIKKAPNLQSRYLIKQISGSQHKKRSRPTLEGPTPTYISTKSDPETE